MPKKSVLIRALFILYLREKVIEYLCPYNKITFLMFHSRYHMSM
jgi:hypothetical protein